MTEKQFLSAPIALFVYNRPTHTRQTVEALQKNELAEKSDLFIFSDSPKKPETAEAVREVREFIKTINGFKSVSIVERDKNWGLANSIIDGVTRLCNEYGRVIVLEDDLLLSVHFLEYMNAALDRYVNEPRVMQISGNMFPLKHPELLPQTFLCKTTTSWGWATWDRAWSEFEPDAVKLAAQIDEKNLRDDFNIGEFDYFRMLQMQARGEVDSWAVRWYASIFLADGLCLHPSRSMVINIGFDGSGTHCASTNVYGDSLTCNMPTNFPVLIEESILGRQALEGFFQSTKRSIWRRLIIRFSRLLLKLAH